MNIMSIATEKRTFGVEIEFYGTTVSELKEELKAQNIKAVFEGYTHTTTSHWKIVTDASVTSTGTGRTVGLEIVSPVLCGLDGIVQLQKVCEALNKAGAKVDRTCGLHIHLDARDLELKDWKNIIIFYYNYQDAIDMLLPKSRRGTRNSYCKRRSESELRDIQKAKTIDGLMSATWDRYKGVNTQSYLRHGTIEFRQHSGTIEFEKIVEWLQFCLAVINKCKSLKSLDIWKQPDHEKEFKAMLTHLRKGGADASSIEYYKARKEQLNGVA